jgi:methyl-accepting chemotaxis protein
MYYDDEDEVGYEVVQSSPDSPSWFDIGSIRIKIILWAGLIIFAVAAVIIAYAAFELYGRAYQDAKEKAGTISQSYVGELQTVFIKALEEENTLSQVLTQVKASGASISRDQVRAMTKEILVKNPEFYRAYIAWEPNAFDNMDAIYAGTKYSSETGRFALSWKRDASGELVYEPLTDMDEAGANYYNLPKKTGKKQWLEPFWNDVQGKKYIMTSLIIPIIVNEKFMGIVGVDITLDFLQKLADEANLYDGQGKMAVISRGGTLVAVTGSPDLIGQPLEKESAEWISYLPGIQAGKSALDETKDGDITSFSPLSLADLENIWSVNVSVPVKVISNEAVGSMWMMILIGVIFLGAGLVLLWVLAERLAAPIRQIAEIAKGISIGELEHEITIKSNDEIGKLAESFRGMIKYLTNMADLAGQLARGHSNVDIQPQSEQDVLGMAYLDMIAYNQNVAMAANWLAQGDLEMAANNAEPKSDDDMLGHAFSRMLDYQKEMSVLAEKLADGDLTAQVKPRSDRDVLGQAFHRMYSNLRSLIQNVSDNAKSLNEASVQLAQVTSQSSLATAQIASTMQEVARAIGQETASVSQTNASADIMGSAINRVAEGVDQQTKTIDQVAVVLKELSSSIEDISQGAVRQAAQMELAEDVEKIMGTAIANAVQAAEEVAHDSAVSAEAASKGEKTSEQTSQGMMRVREATQQLAARVNDLGRRSAEIGAIVETIEDIASTTNLLSLNAAIEAARAGEHGRGFAVVADEVRKLAERSTIATKQIGEMIQTMQNGVKEAVETMEKASDDVQTAAQFTDAAGNAFAQIAQQTRSSADRTAAIRKALESIQDAQVQLEEAVKQANEIAGHNRQIAETMHEHNEEMRLSVDAVMKTLTDNNEATKEMSKYSSEVLQAIEDIAAIEEENSASVEEVTASAEQMNAQVEELTAAAGGLTEMAQELQHTVHEFKLESEGGETFDRE